MISQQQWLDVIAHAARAPSPHNAQPARWLLQGTQVQLFGDCAGWLAAGDPTGRDDLVALGMSWEAMSLALNAQGIELTRPALASGANERRPGLVRLVAHADVVRAGTTDPLAEWQERRGSYRGTFAPATPAQLAALDVCLRNFSDVAVALGEAAQLRIAAWYDDASAEGLRNAAVARELYAFMRFSRRHPRWLLDGLAADCLMLSGVEAWGASWLMRPGFVSLLGKLGMLRLLMSEKPKVLSASRIVLIHGGADESPFAAGRRWYRFWLALTVAGFSGVPMSALADSPDYSRALLAASPLPAGRRLINVMRVGPTPAAVPRSARLPAHELLFTAA